MAHKEQIDFCRSVKEMHPSFFVNRWVLDVGSLDINGNNQYLFENCSYIGIDLLPGRNVDFATKGHEFSLPDASVDTVISTECFEHDSYYADTIKNIVRMLKPGGLFLFSCATTGRPEHGTRRTTPCDAPFTQEFDEWADYYKNLEEIDIRSVIVVDDVFQEYSFSINEITHDLYFWGIKKGLSVVRDDYSFIVGRPERMRAIDDLELQVEAGRSALSTCKGQLEDVAAKLALVESELLKVNADKQHLLDERRELRDSVKVLERTSRETLSQLQFVISSRSWQVSKPLRVMARLLRGEISAYIDSNPFHSIDARSALERFRNGLRYIARGDFDELYRRIKALRQDHGRASIAKRVSTTAGSTWAVVATRHTLFIAHIIAERLRKHGWSVEILTEMPKEFVHGWYFVLCAQMFERMPPGEKRIIFQLEQSVSSRWFSESYLDALEGSLAVVDYALKNLEYLADKGIAYPHVHYLPIGASETYGTSISPEKVFDVLFYGDSNSSPRRRKMLEALKLQFNVKIVSEVFGEEMFTLIKQAKVVINIHYYENALLEMPRIQECISLGTHIVSEASCDMGDYPELDGAVTFFEEGSVSAMLDAVDRVLQLPNNESLKQSLGCSKVRFEFMLDRFLVAMGFLPSSYVGGMVLPLQPSADVICLSLPETISRRNIFLREKPIFCDLFDGVRRHPGWIGCGLSYVALANFAKRNDLPMLTVMEDDVILPDNFEEVLFSVKGYLAKRKDVWHVFAGVIASLNLDSSVVSVEEYRGLKFVTIDRMTSTVMNVYSAAFMECLLTWDPENTDAATNTIDRFIESRTDLKVVVTLPFLFGHREEVNSTLWGFNNIQYRQMILESELLLQEKVDKYLAGLHI